MGSPVGRLNEEWKTKGLHPITMQENAKGYRCWLYIIQCPVTKRVKIGISADADSRLKNMLCHSPTELKMLYKIRTRTGLETAIHKKFAHHRVHHEWFEYGEDLEAYINELKANDGMTNG